MELLFRKPCERSRVVSTRRIEYFVVSPPPPPGLSFETCTEVNNTRKQLRFKRERQLNFIRDSSTVPAAAAAAFLAAIFPLEGTPGEQKKKNTERTIRKVFFFSSILSPLTIFTVVIDTAGVARFKRHFAFDELYSVTRVYFPEMYEWNRAGGRSA